MAKIKNININYIIFFFLYLSILFGFIIGEDALGGAKIDFEKHLKKIEIIIQDPTYYFLNYSELELRHSPVFQMYRAAFLIMFEGGETIFKLLNLHLNISIIFIFYNCLKIKFEKIDKKKLFLLSNIIFLLPSFRAYSIWPDSFLTGFIFFILSIYFLLKLEKINDTSKKINNAYLNITCLCLASYISPNFAPFSIFFMFIFYKNFGLSKNLIKLILLNFIYSLPMIFYIFFLENNFLDFDGSAWVKNQKTLSLNNLSNKIILIPTIFLIFFIPFLNLKFLNNAFKNFYKDDKIKILLIILPFILINFFSYNKINFILGGGGIFFNLLKFFNNYVFLLSLISSVSILIILNFVSGKNKNYLFLLCIFLSNPQLTIYTMYFELILFTSIFLFFERNLFKDFLNKFSYITLLYVYYFIFLNLYFFKNNFYNFYESL